MLLTRRSFIETAVGTAAAFAVPGCATAVIELAKNAGVKLTGPGSTFPLHHDPLDRNIRIAPSYPPLDELKTAIELFCVCVKLAGVRKLLAGKTA